MSATSSPAIARAAAHNDRRARTKIVATVGPACNSHDGLRELVEAGVDVFRVNMAHGTREEHAETVARIREVADEICRPVAILVDLAGPKIRLGELLHDPIDCPLDSEFTFVRGDRSASAHELTCTYSRLIDELSIGDPVMLADGTVTMKVIAKSERAVTCVTTSAGVIRSRQGLNTPGAALSTPALTDADRDNAVWAADAEIDFLGLSFVRTSAEIHELKDLLRWRKSGALVIAKIEKREALERLDEIVGAADGVMVARGDLGVEIDFAQIAVAQKRIIAVCTRQRKPVIVATQMLDSMTHSTRPTRAEATDVANAILDGADACMLSGETAVGRYPKLVVGTMNRIMLATEEILRDVPMASPDKPAGGVHPITAAVVFGAGQIAAQCDAKLVVIATRTGGTARVKAKQRNVIPSVGVSDNAATLRRMCLFWGITPLPGAPAETGPELRRFIDKWGREQGFLSAGDRVVFVTGSGVVQTAHNTLVVHEVE
jgi:pyruvate kinase